MQESIEGGGGHHRIVGEDFAPVAERFIAWPAKRMFRLIRTVRPNPSFV
jgi:hypothetical protein